MRSERLVIYSLVVEHLWSHLCKCIKQNSTTGNIIFSWLLSDLNVCEHVCTHARTHTDTHTHAHTHVCTHNILIYHIFDISK